MGLSWVTWDHKVGQDVILKKYLVGALKATFFAQVTLKLGRICVLMTS